MKVLCLFCPPPVDFTFIHVTFSVFSLNNVVRMLFFRFSDDQENFMVPLKIPGFVAAHTVGD